MYYLIYFSHYLYYFSGNLNILYGLFVLPQIILLYIHYFKDLVET